MIKVGIILIFINIIIWTLEFVFEIELPIASVNFILIIGFGLIGWAFIVILRGFELERKFLGINIKTIFGISLFVIIVCSLLIEIIMNTFIFLRDSGAVGIDEWWQNFLIYMFITELIRLIIFIMIILIGYSFYHIISDIFYDKQFPTLFRFFSPRFLIIGSSIGIIAIIAQIIFLVVIAGITWNFLGFQNADWIIFDLNSNTWIVIPWLSGYIARILMVIFMVFAFLATINSLPRDVVLISSKRVLGFNLFGLFKIGIIMLIVFGITRFITQIFVIRPPRLFGDEEVNSTIFLHIINALHTFFRFVSPIFIIIGYILISIVFYMILKSYFLKPDPRNPNIHKPSNPFQSPIS